MSKENTLNNTCFLLPVGYLFANSERGRLYCRHMFCLLWTNSSAYNHGKCAFTNDAAYWAITP